MKTITFFDTETTGLLEPDAAPLEKQPKVIEVAMLSHKCPDDNWEAPSQCAKINELIDPERSISKEITKITGIKNIDLKGRPLFKDLMEAIIEIILDSDIVVAHNLAFDKGILDYEAKRLNVKMPWPEGGMVCTVENTEHFVGRRLHLDELYEMCFDKRPPGIRHRAIEDTRYLSEIYYHLKKEGSL